VEFALEAFWVSKANLGFDSRLSPNLNFSFKFSNCILMKTYPEWGFRHHVADVEYGAMPTLIEIFPSAIFDTEYAKSTGYDIAAGVARFQTCNEARRAAIVKVLDCLRLKYVAQQDEYETWIECKIELNRYKIICEALMRFSAAHAKLEPAALKKRLKL
jgi:hypothetical protein